MSAGEERYQQERARIEQGHVKYRDKLKAEGKLFVRERLKRLLDPGSDFEEDWLFARSQEADTPADGVVTGVGRVGGRPVCIMANDYTVKAGSWGEKTVQKIIRIQEKAGRLNIPLLYMVDAAGGRISEQIRIFPGRFHAGRIFYNEVQLSGVVPQVCILFGPSPAGSAYLPALTDVVIMVDGKASLYVGSPRMVEMAIGEKTTLEDLGGARMHCTVSGCGDILAGSDEEAIEIAKQYLSYMPSSYRELPARAQPADPKSGRAIDEIVPYDQRKWFDMYEVIDRVIDAGSWFELKRLFAQEIITGFARIGGRTIGIVANQPMVLAGCLDIDSARKGARFVRFCDCFNIPIVTFVDVPGFLPGTAQEYGAIIKHGAKLLFAFAEATVPKVTLITRKAYGGAYDVMSSKHLRGDVNFAWPSAEIAVMGPKGAVEIIFRADLTDAAAIEARAQEYREKFANPFVAASRGFIDDVIEPRATRRRLCRALHMLRGKQLQNPWKKHDNIPL